MKALVLSLFLLVVLSIQLPGTVIAVGDCAASSCSVKDIRNIVTNGWGTTFVSDQLTLTTGSAPVSHLSLGIPSVLSSKLRFTQAVDSQSTQLRVSPATTQFLPSPMTGNYSMLDVAFPSAKTGQYTFNVTNVFADLLSLNATSNNFALTFEPFPFTDGSYTVSSSQLTVKTGDWASTKTTGVNGTFANSAFTTSTPNLQAFNSSIATMTFTSATQTILDITANRTITLSQSGSIQVIDYYNITNEGKDLSSVPLPLPQNVQTAIASDIIPSSTILTAAIGADGTNAVSFTPRFSKLRAGGGASARISYSLPAQNYLTSKGLGKYELSLQMFDNVKFTEPSLTVKIITPMGFHLNSLSGQTFTISGNQITLQVSQVTPLSNLAFVMDYQLDPFWASLSALGWASLAVGSLAAAVLAVGAAGIPGASAFGAPSELIGRFVDLHDEKSAMRLEAEKMDEDLTRGALNRHEYKRRRRAIDLRIAELDRTIAPVKDQLSKANPRYQDMIRRLDRAEADIQVVRTTTSDLKNQYRNGRIAKELYESLTSDLAKRKEKAQQTLDTIVINLKEETR